jgi:hypothetical protein
MGGRLTKSRKPFKSDFGKFPEFFGPGRLLKILQRHDPLAIKGNNGAEAGS